MPRLGPKDPPERGEWKGAGVGGVEPGADRGAQSGRPDKGPGDRCERKGGRKSMQGVCFDGGQ